MHNRNSRSKRFAGALATVVIVVVSVVLAWPVTGDGEGPSTLTVTYGHPYIDVWIDDNWLMIYGLPGAISTVADAFIDGETIWIVGTAAYVDHGITITVVAPIDADTGDPISTRTVIIKSSLGSHTKAVAAEFDPDSGIAYILGIIEVPSGEIKGAFVLAFNVRDSEILWQKGFYAGQKFSVEDITCDAAYVWVTGWVSAPESEDKNILLLGFRKYSGEPVGSAAFGSRDGDEIGKGVAAYEGKVVIAGERVSGRGRKVGLVIYEKDFRIIDSHVVEDGFGDSWFNDVSVLRVAMSGGDMLLYAIAVGGLDDSETIRPLAVEWLLQETSMRYAWGMARKPILRDWSEAVPAEALGVIAIKEFETLGSDFPLISGKMFNSNTEKYMAMSYIYTIEGYYGLTQYMGTYGHLMNMWSFYITKENEDGTVNDYLYMVGTAKDVGIPHFSMFSARVMVSRYFEEYLDWRTCPSETGVHTDIWVAERQDVTTYEKEMVNEDADVSFFDPSIRMSSTTLLKYCEAFSHKRISLTASFAANMSVTTTTVTATETATVTQTVTHESLNVATVTEHHYQTVTEPRTETVTQTVVGTCTAQDLSQVITKQEETTRLLYAVTGVAALTLLAAIIALVRLRPV